MATTTTNFGWDIPESTDLVKDGATAIAALGQDIDTALIDLKGGTTGQILAKASATDLDYSWITNDVGDITEVAVTSPITGGGTSGVVTIAIQDGTTAQKGAIQLEDSTSSTSTTKAATPNSVKSAYDLANAAIPKSLVDAAGDLIYATADNTVARLAIGTANQVLAVNSGATAPEWVTAGGASGLTLISTTTMSAVSAQNLEGIFTSTYTNYLVVISELVGSADPITPRFQYLYSTNTVQSGGYFGGLCGINYLGASDSNNVGNDFSQTLYTLPTLASATQSAATMTFFGPNLGGNKATVNIDWKSMGTGDRYVGAGAQNTSRSYTGLRFTTASGTMSGTISVYGLAK
jgi:hypothetical protein